MSAYDDYLDWRYQQAMGDAVRRAQAQLDGMIFGLHDVLRGAPPPLRGPGRDLAEFGGRARVDDAAPEPAALLPPPEAS